LGRGEGWKRVEEPGNKKPKEPLFKRENGNQKEKTGNSGKWQEGEPTRPPRLPRKKGPTIRRPFRGKVGKKGEKEKKIRKTARTNVNKNLKKKKNSRNGTGNGSAVTKMGGNPNGKGGEKQNLRQKPWKDQKKKRGLGSPVKDCRPPKKKGDSLHV